MCSVKCGRGKEDEWLSRTSSTSDSNGEFKAQAKDFMKND